MLHGSIPASLGNCSQVVSLHLSVNYPTGRIPLSLGYLSKLKDLKLWLNQLQGGIPQELSNIQTLETLILDFNELTRPIPYGSSNCTRLSWISLSVDRRDTCCFQSLRFSSLAITPSMEESHQSLSDQNSWIEFRHGSPATLQESMAATRSLHSTTMAL
ncbi:hypothetical protein V6N13_136564 [Hibiscus sabdariffa]|uniref:Uncharacterized protein n=1 Tax=Hibiscus sabdariffa TaxID=183260 RepID=A0ABR2DN86_9ROSI